MPPLNNTRMQLEDDKLYRFVLNNAYPATRITYKQIALYRYIYTYNSTFHMEVLLRHDEQNTPDLLHTFTLDPVDYIPLISEMKKDIAGLPSVINLTKATPTKKAPTKFHNYILEVEY